MSTAVLFFSVLIIGSANVSNDLLQKHRALYFAEASETELMDAISAFNDHPAGQAVLTAYKGAHIARSAQFSYNPYTKFSRFNDGKRLIEEAVERENIDPEIRFIRFSVQVKSPDFLRYKNQVADDLALVIDALKRGWLLEETLFRKNVCSFIQDHIGASHPDRALIDSIVFAR
jgi:hypothetical protein